MGYIFLIYEIESVGSGPRGMRQDKFAGYKNISRIQSSINYKLAITSVRSAE